MHPLHITTVVLLFFIFFHRHTIAYMGHMGHMGGGDPMGFFFVGDAAVSRANERKRANENERGEVLVVVIRGRKEVVLFASSSD